MTFNEPFDVDEILVDLTLKEKMQLLSLKNYWETCDVPRLGVPSLRLSDGPNGVRGSKFFGAPPAACFPSGTALGATFNAELVDEAGRMMAMEGKSKGFHVILAPTCNIVRGPLGGRGFESFSEDPYLSGVLAAGIINGIQSQGLAASIKHFVCNDQEHERKGVDILVTQRALREVYLMPFQLALSLSSPKCVMSSYNKVNGEHVSGSRELLTTVLRNEWGWQGTVLSDWPDALIHAVVCREIDNGAVDQQVREVLNLVKHFVDTGAAFGDAKISNDVPETRRLLRRIATESIVLLKNDKNLLPLKKSETVAVIGPNARSPRMYGGGSAALTPYYTTTVYDSVRSKLGSEPPYALGCTIDRNLLVLGLFSSYAGRQGVRCRVYKRPAGASKRTLIEEFYSQSTKLPLYDYSHPDLDEKLFYMDIEGIFTAHQAGDYAFKESCLGTLLLYLDGELFIDDKTEQKQSSGVIASSSLGATKYIYLEKGQKVHFRIEFGSAPTFTLSSGGPNGGCGFLDVAVMRRQDESERILEAVEVATKVQKVIVCTGTSHEWESEGFDRTSMELPGVQDRLIKAVAEVNGNVIVVNLSGTPVAMPWIDQVPAVVQGWFIGMESGNAIADVLYGEANPSGKLSMTFPRRCEDNPSFLNFRSNNGQILYGEDVFVGYRYYEKTGIVPLFPFGHGLSYTSFELSDLHLELEDEWMYVTVTVHNTGAVAGQEVVQLYIAAPEDLSSVELPLKQLKGFAKVQVLPGRSATASIRSAVRHACSYFDVALNRWVIPKGTYTAMVGNSSAASGFLLKTFSFERTRSWTGL
ncbi:hypothetical protein KL950_004369 [Ogataea haglerorum]|nr:hypothetical protein KL915_004797 [Ogataea haglerorum]KAG7704042.1 hypothetical protein KL950_004369 [Ogataea haglerorum]